MWLPKTNNIGTTAENEDYLINYLNGKKHSYLMK